VALSPRSSLIVESSRPTTSIWIDPRAYTAARPSPTLRLFHAARDRKPNPHSAFRRGPRPCDSMRMPLVANRSRCCCGRDCESPHRRQIVGGDDQAVRTIAARRFLGRDLGPDRAAGRRVTLIDGHLLDSFAAPSRVDRHIKIAHRLNDELDDAERHRGLSTIQCGDPMHGVARNIALLTPQFSCCFAWQSDFGRSGRPPWVQSLRISPKAGLWRGSQRALPRED
jgi:hypothetical protein